MSYVCGVGTFTTLHKTPCCIGPGYAELRRIHLPRTWVNKAIYSTLQLRFCLNEFLDVSKALLHRGGDGVLHRFIDRHLSTHR